MPTSDKIIAAKTLWQEARGEPAVGRQAVAHVLVNRMRNGLWGITYAEVCLSEFKGIYQFSGWGRNDPNRKAAFRLPDSDPLLLELLAVLEAAEGEPDPTGGATHYYAASMKLPPPWVQGATPCGQFGNQLFFKDVK